MFKTNLYIWLSLFALVFTVSTAHAQKTYGVENTLSIKTEELRQVLKEHLQKDTFRVNRLIELCDVLQQTQPVEIEDFSEEALLISRKLRYEAGEVNALLAKAKVALYHGKREIVLDLLIEADRIARKINNPVLQFKGLILQALYYAEKDNSHALRLALEAEVLARISGKPKLLSIAQLRAAETYTNLSNYAMAMEYSLKSLKNGELAQCFECMTKCLTRIGSIYALVGNYEKSNSYYQRLKEAYIQHGVGNAKIAELHYFIGENYHRMGRNYPEALEHLTYAIHLDSSEYRRSVAEIELADVYLQMDSLKSAFKYAFSSLRLAKKENDLVLQSWINSILSNAYIKMKMPDSTLYYARLGLSQAKRIGNIEHICNNSLALAKAYSLKNDFKDAFNYHQLYVLYRDSMLNAEVKNKIEIQEHTFELEKKQNEIESLNQQKNTQQKLLVAVSVSLFSMLAIAVGMLRNNRQKAKYFHQRQLLVATVNAQEEVHKRISRDLHDELGAVLSMTRMYLVQLRDGNGTTDSVDIKPMLQEACDLTEAALATMRRISTELMPPLLEQFGLAKTLQATANQINKTKNLSVDLAVPDENLRFSALIELGIYRIALELINNTIKHAHARHISILLLKDPENLVFIYSDDGIGLPPSYDLGRGFSNIETRVNVMAGTLTIDKKNANGFKATVTVPHGLTMDI